MSYNPNSQPQQPSPASHVGEASALAAPKKKHHGSDKRPREKIISVRVYDNERLKIEANAAAVDLCTSAYLRMLGTGQQRAQERRRPKPDMKEVGRLLGECGRIGGNIHQLLRHANFGDPPSRTELEAAGKEARALFAAVCKAFGI
jgi:hypothetical protein